MLVVGLSHHTAPIAVRERLAVSGDAQRDLVHRLAGLEGVAEVVLVSTCNRVEIIAAPAPDANHDRATAALTTVLAELGGRDVIPHLRTTTELAAVRHLFRVASSLDSLVVGEPQILGQLKDAIRLAQDARTVGPRLAPVLRHAMHVAKRVRTETEIGSGQVSVPSVAIDLAHRIFESFEGHVALLVGAGEMAEAAAKLLARHGARLIVVNRSPERGAELAASVGGTPRRWDELTDALTEADIVVTSTASPRPVITKDLVRNACKRRRGRSLFLIDIAVPRDVAPEVNELDNVYLYDIDDLSRAVAQSLAVRAAEAERAEAIVAEETRTFLTRRSQDAVKPVVVALRDRVRGVLAAELDRSLKGRLKHLTAADRESLEAMTDAAVNKLLHGPTTQLKALAMQQRSDEAVGLLTELFALEEAMKSAENATIELPDDDDTGETTDQGTPRAVAR
jgi:glutamyl-tRNA reductase